jgi:hypothetical protein
MTSRERVARYRARLRAEPAGFTVSSRHGDGLPKSPPEPASAPERLEPEVRMPPVMYAQVCLAIHPERPSRPELYGDLFARFRRLKFVPL